MTWLKHIFMSKADAAERKTSSPSAREKPQMPTVRFDPSLVTKKVKADLLQNVEQLEDVPKKWVGKVYTAALAMVESGENMPVLYNVLLGIDGVTTARASEITRALLGKARALTEQEKRVRLGITHAIWLYANAPCMTNPSQPTSEDLKQDAAHRAANGKRFEIQKGLLLNGEWILPGRANGCKCISRSVLPV